MRPTPAGGQNLVDQLQDGERIRLYAAFNERDESDFVVHRIREWCALRCAARGRCFTARTPNRGFEGAFCERTHALSVKNKNKRRLRFFDRAEIKDGIGVFASHAAARMTPLPLSAWSTCRCAASRKTVAYARQRAANTTSLWKTPLPARKARCRTRGLAAAIFHGTDRKLARESNGRELHGTGRSCNSNEAASSTLQEGRVIVAKAGSRTCWNSQRGARIFRRKPRLKPSCRR